MCAEELLFSLTPLCHFLPLHPTSPQNAASCPSLVASEVPPSPSGMAQDFTLSLSNIQEVWQTNLQLWSLTWTLSKIACCENDWNKTEAYGVFASSWVKHRWIFVCCHLGHWMSKTEIWAISMLWERYIKMNNGCVSQCLCCSLLSCLGSPCIWNLTVTSWVVPSSAPCTMCRQHKRQEL